MSAYTKAIRKTAALRHAHFGPADPGTYKTVSFEFNFAVPDRGDITVMGADVFTAFTAYAATLSTGAESSMVTAVEFTRSHLDWLHNAMIEGTVEHDERRSLPLQERLAILAASDTRWVAEAAQGTLAAG